MGITGNRGRVPVNGVTADVRQQVLEWARGKYRGFNDRHLRDKLASEEKLTLSRSTVRRILRPAGRMASPA